MPEQLTPAQAQIEESRRQLRAALEHGVTASPEAEASLQREARQRDMTPDTLRSIRSQGVALPPALGDWYGLPETHPSTARTLSRPGVAGVAHDDIPALQSVEGAIRNIPSIGANRNTRFNFGSFLGGIRTAFVEGAQQSVKGAQLQLGDLLNTTAPFGRDVYGNAIGGFTPANRATVQGDYQASSERLTQATPEIANPVLSGAYSGLQSLAQTAPGLALSVVTRNPAFALGSAGVQVETQAYGKYTGRGASMGEATLGAVGEGSVEVVTELLPMGTLVKGFGKDALGKFLKDYVVQEGVGEQIATLAQDAIDTAIANPDKTWGEYFRERPNAALQTAVATFVQTGVIGGSSALARRADQFVQTRAQVDNAATTIESIIKTAEASRLRERDPQTFEQFVADAAEGGPVENVYVDANVFAQTLQAAGTTVEEVSQAVPAVAEQIGQAMADGGDIRIPVEQFAAHMATADYGQALTDHLRVDPSLPSRAEVSALSADQGAALQDEATRILTAEATTTEFQASAERVRDSFVEQLNTAGRFTKDVNTAYAALVSNFYTVKASQLGITPEEMAARYPLQVASEAPGGKATTLPQSAVNPSGRQMARMLGQAKEGSLRGVVSPSGALVFWDAFDAIHKEGAEQNGVPYFPEGVDNRLEARIDEDTGYPIVGFTEGLPPAWIAPLLRDERVLFEDGGEIVTGPEYAERIGFAEPAIDPETGREDEQATVNVFPPSPLTLYQSQPAFYSALARAVAETQTKRASADQWKATIAKTAGVKKDEIEWSGVNEWLDGQVGPIDREALSTYLAQGGVQLEEVVLGETPPVTFDDGSARPYVLRTTDGDAIEWFETEAEAIAWARKNDITGTQFSEYKMPGADDTYREVLLTLPAIQGPSTHWDTDNVVAHARITTREDATGAKVLFIEEVQSDWHQKGRDEGYESEADPAAEDAAREAVRSVDAEMEAAVASFRQQAEDIINARLDMLETALDAGDAPRSYERLQEQYADHLNGIDPTSPPEAQARAVRATFTRADSLPNPTAEQYEAYGAAIRPLQLRRQEASIALQDATNNGGIPDAPFRTSWSTLVMKRMIRYAVDTGHDKVAWINGNQQNGGQTGGDGTFFYERNLVNTTNDLLKKLGGRVEKIDMLANAPGSPRRDLYTIAQEQEQAGEASGFGSSAEIGRPANALGIQNGFVITDQMRDVAAKGFPLFQENRGSITFEEDITQSPSVISLLRTADLSTFLHETGHFFLEVNSHIANSADAPAEIVADMDATLNWFRPGLTLAEWNALPLEEKRPYHEQFARGFEAFLFEGRSPSAEMRGIFQRFSDWLRNVYKSLAALDVELTDEVRSVMGRMVASAEEIKDAEDAKAFGALYETKPEGMTDDAWTEYQRAAAAATEDGMSTLSTRTARDMQWASNAKSRALKLLQRENAEQRKVVKAEVAAEVRAEPVYRARDFLRRGTDAEGNPVENAGKLDLATLKATYGEETTALWRGLRIGGKYGDAGENGLNPDAVAELFGFDSGDALVRALIRAEDPNAKINGLTDQRMLERFGDITDDKSLDRAANEAVANDARLRFVATEYAVAAQLTGSPRALAAAAKTYAAGIVNRLVLKRLKPAQFFAAQTRAAKAAEKAHGKGDVAEVAKQKRNQLVNLQAARYALDGQAQVNKSLNLFKRIISAKDDAIAKSYDMNLVNAARAILAQYGVGRVKNDPSAYLDALSRYEPTLYADIKPFVDRAKQDAKPVEELTLEEFRGMAETVRQLWTLARSIKTVEIDGQRRTLDAIREELGARLSELKPGQAPITADPTEFERDIRGFQGIRASLRRVESWVRGIDGGDTGPFRTYFWNPVSEAADAYRVEQARFVERYLEILKPIEATLTAAKIAAPELGGFVFQGRQQLLHAILHTGNQSNLSKLLLGRAWGRQNADGSLDTSKWDGFVARMVAEGQITKADYDVAQQIWDLLDETKPAAQRAHLEMYGRYFSEVTADEIVTPFGTYRGGYVPALTDTFHVQDAAIRSEENALKESQSAMFPAASNGFTKSRVEDYNRELALDMRLLPMHLDKVLKFTHMGPVVRNAARILKGRAFSAQLQAFDPVAQTDLLLPWLQRAATQVVERPAEGWAGRATDKAFRTIRSRVGMQLMFANLSNTAQQLTGFSQLAARVKKRDLQHALWAHVRNPKASAGMAAEKSKFMASRTSSQVFEMRQAIDQLLLNPNTYEKAREFTKRHGYFTQSAFQNFVDIIGWHAAYNMATARGDVEKEAVRFADSVIRETQGSMAAEDVARFETGTAFHRLFTQFLGYSNMTANLNATEIQVVARGIGVKKGAGRLFYVYLTAFAIPALLADAIAQAFRGTIGDEDDDGYLDDFLGWFFGSQLRFGASMVPVVGQVASALAGGFTEKPFDDKISTNPTFSVLESSARVPSQVSKSIFEGESFDRRDIRDTMTLMGIVTGYPLGALGKPIGYQAGVMQGDIAPTSPLDYARGLATGTPSEDSKTN